MEIKHIFVVEVGTMGSGIAQLAAISGKQVAMMAVISEQSARATAAIKKSTGKLLGKLHYSACIII